MSTHTEAVAPAPRWPLLLPGTVLAMAMAAYALRLALQAGAGASLHVDEAQYWDWSRHLQWGYYSKPPVIAMLIAASTAWLGDGETGVRALAMACWPITALVLAALARELVPPGAASRAAAWTAAVVLCSPIAALLGLVATTDAPLALSWSVAIAALWHGTVRGGRHAWAVFALAVGVGLLSKYTFAALLPGAAAFVFWHGRPPQRRAFLLAAGAGLLLAAPNLVWNLQHGWPTWRHTAAITVQSAASADPWRPLVEFGISQLLIAAPLVLPLAGLRPPAAPWLVARAPGLLLCTALPLTAAGLLQAWRGHAEVNWIVPSQLVLMLALGCLVAQLPTPRRLAASLLLVLQVLLLCGLTLAPRLAGVTSPAGTDWPLALDPWARMRGWDQAFASLALALPAPGSVALVVGNRALAAHGAYHLRAWQPLRAVPAGGAFASDHYQFVCPWLGDGAPAGSTLFALVEGDQPPEFLHGRPASRVALASARVRRGREVVLSLWAWPAEASGATRWCR